MTFENSQIDISALPALANVAYQRLAPAHRSVAYIGTAIVAGVLFIGCMVVFFSVPDGLGWVRWGAIAVWLAISGVAVLLVGKQYEAEGYALREHDVTHKHGVWWHTVTTIPFNRMQHCEISQGPVQGIFGLASLRVFTAGGTSSDLAIDGLERAEAERIKAFIMGKINPEKDETPLFFTQEKTTGTIAEPTPDEPL